MLRKSLYVLLVAAFLAFSGTALADSHEEAENPCNPCNPCAPAPDGEGDDS